ncbi:acetyltransferase [Candidatus Formimonas warabiya]|uniref:Transferase n=1 Tax=Formimonas warabiya TaxID=1761012 RepID=A0A3G1KWX7_FORW1|nr:acetyltransferase [Candidatus Formimonas warabiya]ATW26956.1 transferase [Candidatus Formimonas warabiya]
MKDIVVIGAGNFGREVAQLIREINEDQKTWHLLGFIDETPEKHGTLINDTKVLGGFNWFEKKRKKISVVCAIGNARDKYAVINKSLLYRVDYPNLIHPTVKMNKYMEIGYGNIICWNSFISVNTKIGNYVTISPGCGIGHDAIIDDYSTLYWDITLSGNVWICRGCEIGSKAVVIPKKIVGKWSIIGAGAVVINNLPENCTAVGVPAKPIKFLNSPEV